ncbi:MAG: hypothetical protein IKG46_10325 [Solobacterium sp.]|nr:hypothetical protein [Solobacterium sp.]
MDSLFAFFCSLLIRTAETSLDITSGNSCFQKDVRSLKKKAEQDQGGEKNNKHHVRKGLIIE